MAKYTQKELLHLRDSPLVKRPAHLPAIEQWIDEGKSNARQPRTSGAAVAMGSFGHCNLAKARAARGDDVSLGPPKVTFASSRSAAKVKETGEKATDGTDGVQEGSRKDRQRRNGDWASRNKESWADARQRRAQNGGEETKPETERRAGGWRQQRQPRAEADTGKTPEWMDDASAKQEDTTVARTQEEFEQWKRAQHARNRKEETAPEAPAKPTPKPAPQPTPLSEQPNIFGPGFFDKWKEDENQARLQLPVMGVKKSKFADIWESETSKEMAPPKSAPEPSTDDEDKRGFDRILAMLGNANINRVDTAPPEQPSSTAQTKTKSRYSGFFEQQQDERRPASGPIPSYRGPDVNLQHIIHQKPMADPNEGKKQSNYLLELMMGSSKQPQPQPQQTLTQQQPQPQPHPQPQPQPPQQLGHPPQQPIPHPPQPQQPFPHWMEPPLPMGTRSVPEQMIDDHHRNHAGPFGNLMPLPPQMGGMPLMGPPGPGRGFMPPPGFTRAMPPVPPGMPYHPSLGPPTREPLHYPTPAGGGAPRMPPGFFNAPQHVMDGAGARYETR